jgi:demethylmenaquinone methyltransferase/2-methoxy-6-polyprenyl-1,4-benzoquinol methylase
MTQTDLYIQRLLETNPIREPLLRSVIQSLQLSPGSRGLDAGCGIGLQSVLLIEAIGQAGHVTGLDILPELLVHGTEMVKISGLDGQISFREGDVGSLPFEDDSFDWAWSADCIGYPAGELVPVLGELKRVVRPGGSILLLGWTSQQFLPGYPLLEARLNGTCSGYLPYLKKSNPGLNFMRAAGALNQAGLEQVEARTVVSDVMAPLHEGQRTALVSLFEMLWGTPQAEVSPEDWQEYQRLCRPGSPDFILDLPDYYGFFTCTMFRGRVSK